MIFGEGKIVEQENKNYCSRCGTELDGDKELCDRCATDEQTDETDTGNEFVTALKNYIGKNKDYYLKKWKLDSEGKPTKTLSMNWAGFFLTVFWAGYRKMYGLILIIFGVLMALDIIVYLADLPVNSSIGVVVSVIFGLNGNQLYYDKAKKAIEKSDGSQSSAKELQDAGGTSKLGILFTVAVFVVYIAISVFIIDPIFAGPPEVEFGLDSEDGEVIELTDRFEPFQEMHVASFFDDGEGGAFEILIEKEEEDSTTVYTQWEDEVPLDWPGMLNVIEAPDEEGTYILKVIKDGETSSEGTFEVENQE